MNIYLNATKNNILIENLQICPHRDLNPGLGDEDPVSWTGLDDGGYGLFNIYSEF